MPPKRRSSSHKATSKRPRSRSGGGRSPRASPKVSSAGTSPSRHAAGESGHALRFSAKAADVDPLPSPYHNTPAEDTPPATNKRKSTTKAKGVTPRSSSSLLADGDKNVTYGFSKDNEEKNYEDERRSSSSGSSDKTEALQRFSNTSAHHRNKRNSPPQLSTTPPPSPPRSPHRARSRSQHNKDNVTRGREMVEVIRSEYTAMERGFMVRVSPPAVTDYDKEEYDGQQQDQQRQQQMRDPPTSLLSALLIAEAERAGAAESDALVGLPPSLTYTQMAASGLYPSADLQGQELSRRSSTYAAAPSTHASMLARHPFVGAGTMQSVAGEQPSAVAVQIGVVPLPGSTLAASTGPTKNGASCRPSSVLPWVRALAAKASADMREQHGDDDERNRSESDVHQWNNLAAEKNACVRFLQPRRLLVRSQSTSAASTPSLSYSMQSGQETRLWTAEASDVVGWSGLFVDVPVVLPGAELVTEQKKAHSATEVDGEAEVVPPGTQVCLGAASVLLMLV